MASLADIIADLATAWCADARLTSVQAQVRQHLGVIEQLVERGVSLRRLAEALAAAGVTQRRGQPLSYAHLRKLVTRARTTTTQGAAHVASSSTRTVHRVPHGKALAPAPPSTAVDFFDHRQRQRAERAREAAQRPDFDQALPRLRSRPRD